MASEFPGPLRHGAVETQLKLASHTGELGGHRVVILPHWGKSLSFLVCFLLNKRHDGKTNLGKRKSLLQLVLPGRNLSLTEIRAETHGKSLKQT